MAVFTWAQFPASPGLAGAVPWAFSPDWLDDLPPWYVDEGAVVTPTPTPGGGARLLGGGVRRRRRLVDDDELIIIGAL